MSARHQRAPGPLGHERRFAADALLPVQVDRVTAGQQFKTARLPDAASRHSPLWHARWMPTSFQPQLWVDGADAAVSFYMAAFRASVLHLVGEGDQIVAQLAVGDAAFWVSAADPSLQRLDPRAMRGTTSRTLLVVDDPDDAIQVAVRAGATEISPVADEHGWRLGRIVDPFGHEWEIGAPLGPWPPA